MIWFKLINHLLCYYSTFTNNFSRRFLLSSPAGTYKNNSILIKDISKIEFAYQIVFLCLQGSTGREARRTYSFNVKPHTKMADEEYPDSPPTSRKRHKPLTVKKMSPNNLVDCPICGCLERRLINGEWIRSVKCFSKSIYLYNLLNHY